MPYKNALQPLFPKSNLNTAYQTIRESLNSNHEKINQAQLSPQYGYLRFWLNDREALLVRELSLPDSVSSDTVPAKNQTAHNLTSAPFIWYSQDRRVFKTQSGRYLGSIGLEKNWSNVEISHVPHWDQLLIASKKKPIAASRAALIPPVPLASFKRSYDQIPVANMSVQERVSVFKLASAPKDIPLTVVSLLSKYSLLSPSPIHWFLEEVESSNLKEFDSIRGYYALTEDANGKATLVFGQQCLKKDMCFAWMPWGPK